MNAIRQFIDVKNNSFSVLLPDDFKASKVEVIILPIVENDHKLDVETKKMLDNRLNDYLENPKDVQYFDALLNELEGEI
jgi:hypothetical protein